MYIYISLFLFFLEIRTTNAFLREEVAAGLIFIFPVLTGHKIRSLLQQREWCFFFTITVATTFQADFDDDDNVFSGKDMSKANFTTQLLPYKTHTQLVAENDPCGIMHVGMPWILRQLCYIVFYLPPITHIKCMDMPQLRNILPFTCPSSFSRPPQCYTYFTFYDKMQTTRDKMSSFCCTASRPKTTSGFTAKV